jgi:hypothetical protein
MLDDAGEKLGDLDTDPVHSNLEEVRVLITKEDGETPIAVEALEAAAAEMAEQQAEDGDEDVVEADFEVVDSDDDE